MQALGGQRIAERLHHMLLPHHFGEVLRAVFAGQDNVRHGGDSKVWGTSVLEVKMRGIVRQGQ